MSLSIGERLRTDTDAHTITGAGYRDSYNPGGYTLAPYTTFTYYRSIKDNPVPSIHKPSGLRNVKPVLHEKASVLGSTEIRDFPSLALPELIRTYGMKHTASPQALLDCLPSLSDADRSDLCREAFNTFTTQFPEEISLGNFIYELRELPSLLPKLERTLSETIAGGYLNLEFGWLPFLDDLKTLGSLVSRIEKRLQFLRETSGRPTRLGFHRKLDVSQDPVEIPSPVPYGPTLVYVPKTVTLEFRAGATLLQDLQDLDSWQAYLRAFLGTTGLTNPTKVVWNTLPFSFVLGWFVELESRLDSLNIQQATLDFSVWNTSHSVKSFSRGDLFLLNKSSFMPNPERYQHLGVVTLERYERQPGFPTAPTAVGWSGLSPKQLALTLAMLT
ncbi:maturation protein [ssRNA phage SRR6255746_3]|uniref:Maturation protein n=1 Tax=ssRNA phage SRR6255746_3 TaxID=2786505 RepID=A0A8S5KZ06_9VIRU|nr:maturation protein [ssRNA phage SRR6255746_3]DAD50966.1 TPA_asm: maturation protein [ssRNA phage SRR6255746_3]